MKISINWGTSIVIAFSIFITFILYFVVKVQTDSKYDNDLVVEEYYKHDAKYSDEMAQLQNALELKEKPTIQSTGGGIEVVFPKNISTKNITGKISLYRPSDKKLDFEIPISTSGTSTLIPNSDLAGGLWDITVSWSVDDKKYLQRETIYL